MTQPRIITPKQSFRKEIIALRRSLSPGERREKSRAAQAWLMGQSLWRQAACVALYAALPEETDTVWLLESAWAEGKTVFLPRVDARQEGRMDFVRCAGWEDMLPGAYGIREPHPDLPPVPLDEEAGTQVPDIFVLPGVAFDRQGQRLGFGGGFYDRFVARSRWQCPSVGLCFGVQLVASFPADVVDPWDMKVTYCCTEEAWLPCQ